MNPPFLSGTLASRMQAGYYDFDAIVVGGGSGGFAAARTLSSGGLRTAVIEGGREVGGLCILRGCMPTKALLQASEVLHQARKGSVWGLDIPATGFDVASVMRRKERLISEFADYRRHQLESGKFEFIRAQASFEGPHQIRLSDGRKLSAENFVLATGSSLRRFPIPGLEESGYLTSDSALELRKLPASITVLGGGAVAVEFAQFFARFDVRVTVLQRSPQLVKEFDEDAAQELQKVFVREGIAVHTGVRLLRVECGNGRRRIFYEQAGMTRSVESDEIFVALGRMANTAGMNLEAAGVETDDHRIISNSAMQTSAPHIYAAGDCTGPHEIVHIAIQQGELAAHNILHSGDSRKMDYRLLTSVIFTEPQLAQVGLNEKIAQTQNIPYLAAKYPFNDHGKSLILDATDGFVKLLAEPESGEILGGVCVGPMGGELIHEIVAAMYKRMTVQELAAMPHYHPTLAEIWTYPAEDLAGQIQ